MPTGTDGFTTSSPTPALASASKESLLDRIAFEATHVELPWVVRLADDARSLFYFNINTQETVHSLPPETFTMPASHSGISLLSPDDLESLCQQLGAPGRSVAPYVSLRNPAGDFDPHSYVNRARSSLHANAGAGTIDLLQGCAPNLTSEKLGPLSSRTSLEAPQDLQHDVPMSTSSSVSIQSRAKDNASGNGARRDERYPAACARPCAFDCAWREHELWKDDLQRRFAQLADLQEAVAEGLDYLARALSDLGATQLSQRSDNPEESKTPAAELGVSVTPVPSSALELARLKTFHGRLSRRLVDLTVPLSELLYAAGGGVQLSPENLYQLYDAAQSSLSSASHPPDHRTKKPHRSRALSFAARMGMGRHLGNSCAPESVVAMCQNVCLSYAELVLSLQSLLDFYQQEASLSLDSSFTGQKDHEETRKSSRSHIHEQLESRKTRVRQDVTELVRAAAVLSKELDWYRFSIAEQILSQSSSVKGNSGLDTQFWSQWPRRVHETLLSGTNEAETHTQISASGKSTGDGGIHDSVQPSSKKSGRMQNLWSRKENTDQGAFVNPFFPSSCELVHKTETLRLSQDTLAPEAVEDLRRRSTCALSDSSSVLRTALEHGKQLRSRLARMVDLVPISDASPSKTFPSSTPSSTSGCISPSNSTAAFSAGADGVMGTIRSVLTQAERYSAWLENMDFDTSLNLPTKDGEGCAATQRTQMLTEQFAQLRQRLCDGVDSIAVEVQEHFTNRSPFSVEEGSKAYGAGREGGTCENEVVSLLHTFADLDHIIEKLGSTLYQLAVMADVGKDARSGHREARTRVHVSGLSEPGSRRQTPPATSSEAITPKVRHRAMSITTASAPSWNGKEQETFSPSPTSPISPTTTLRHVPACTSPAARVPPITLPHKVPDRVSSPGLMYLGPGLLVPDGPAESESAEVATFTPGSAPGHSARSILSPASGLASSFGSSSTSLSLPGGLSLKTRNHPSSRHASLSSAAGALLSSLPGTSSTSASVSSAPPSNPPAGPWSMIRSRSGSSTLSSTLSPLYAQITGRRNASSSGANNALGVGGSSGALSNNHHSSSTPTSPPTPLSNWASPSGSLSSSSYLPSITSAPGPNSSDEFISKKTGASGNEERLTVRRDKIRRLLGDEVSLTSGHSHARSYSHPRSRTPAQPGVHRLAPDGGWAPTNTSASASSAAGPGLSRSSPSPTPSCGASTASDANFASTSSIGSAAPATSANGGHTTLHRADTTGAAASWPPPQPKAEQAAWFLEPGIASEDMIITPDGHIKGATLEALMVRLTIHDKFDAPFNNTFLLTYRSFTTTEKFLELLFERFRVKMPENLNPAEAQSWAEKMQRPVQLRVFNVLKSWLELYHLPHVDQVHFPRLRAFAQDEMASMPSMKLPSMQLLRLIDKHEQPFKASAECPSRRLPGYIPPPPKRMLGTPAPQPIMPRNPRKVKLLDLDPLEVARQLTLKESETFCTIKPFECLNKAFARADGEERAPGIKGMIRNSNALTNWVTASLLEPTDPKKRALILRHWISIADRARQLQNFATMMTITGALVAAAIRRLHKTWHQVSAQAKSQLEHLDSLMGNTRNYSAYRAMIHHLDPPCIPYIGVYLTDLTFIEDGNPDRLRVDERLINFSKRQKTADVIQEIMVYQSTPYVFFL